jgi:hypothetical protein
MPRRALPSGRGCTMREDRHKGSGRQGEGLQSEPRPAT